ncbi:MAG: ATP phosphoribosyltransferase [Chloroflexi bacterium]|jgi:ATP phosphoribosyltransferase|nr:MAG: ATP phosphoribosyltransferase [Chloroflexota bacterium]|tara:strand:+ start:1545 stop:2915 length:1371 start_codon:yes stop_codon:yes gene_type:complete
MIKLALPRGSIQKNVANILLELSIDIPDYNSANRVYSYEFNNMNDAVARSFAEKDIPIQVALGNYDLGIVTSWWVDELLIKYPHLSIENLISFNDSVSTLYSTTSNDKNILNDNLDEHIIITEFPNITTNYLYTNRTSNYRVFEAWGNPENWLHGDASIAILPEEKLTDKIKVIDSIYQGGMLLIGNRKKNKNIKESNIFKLLNKYNGLSSRSPFNFNGNKINEYVNKTKKISQPRKKIRLAIPDGHAFKHTALALNDAGINISGYTDVDSIGKNFENDLGMDINIMRPQDMPQAVALGLYDIAITGRDWLKNFVFNYPNSPVEEIHDLQRSKYKIGAVVSQDLNCKNINEAFIKWENQGIKTIRIASEYYGIADHFARNSAANDYKIIPISGASEGFVPHDAEILVEGVETGATLKANNLEMLDVILESTNIIIANKNKHKLIEDKISLFLKYFK